MVEKLKVNRKYSHEYVCCLPKPLEKVIMDEVRKAISSLLLSDSEKEEAIQNANNSKVCDLTDTVSVQFV